MDRRASALAIAVGAALCALPVRARAADAPAEARSDAPVEARADAPVEARRDETAPALPGRTLEAGRLGREEVRFGAPQMRPDLELRAPAFAPADGARAGEEGSGARAPFQPPAPQLPERPVFEELLRFHGDMGRELQGGFLTTPLALAIRARAPAFVQVGERDPNEAKDILTRTPMEALTWSDLPAGPQVARLLYQARGAETHRVRDLGLWLRGPEGPLARVERSVVQSFPGGKVGAGTVAGAAALGVIYQFGTAALEGVGLRPLFTASAFEKRLRTSLLLQSGPRFEGLRAEVAAHYQLPTPLQGELAGLELLEMGVAGARTPTGVLIDGRWARLHGRVSWLRVSLGMSSALADPNVWTGLDLSVEREHFCVRTNISRQWATSRHSTSSTATVNVGPLMTGLFVNTDGPWRRTMGLIGMAIF